MDDIIYKDITNGNYYLITMKENDVYNICVDLKTFNNKIITNDVIDKCQKIQLNKNNIYNILNDLNYIDLSYIDLKDYNNYNYLIYKSQTIKINNWIDFFNFIATLI